MTITRKNKEILLELRRERVQQLASRGYSQREIAKELGISLGLVNRDINWIKKHARERLRQYISKTLPEEMELSLARLSNMIKQLYKDIDDPSISKRDKHSAMQLVNQCTQLKLEILGAEVLADQLNSSRQQQSSQQQQQTQEQKKQRE